MEKILNATSVGIKNLESLNLPTFFGRISAIFIVLQRVNFLVDILARYLHQLELKDPWLKLNK